MPIKLNALIKKLSDGKTEHHSIHAIETIFYNPDRKDFSGHYEHDQIRFRIPYSFDYEDVISRILLKYIPDYDMIIWRIEPEVVFYRYVLPINIGLDITTMFGLSFEPDMVTCDIEKGENPDFVYFYTRFSLGKNNKQVKLNYMLEV